MSNNVHSRYTIVKRGKLVTFYKNGDPYHKGLQTSVSGKHFVTLSTLLSWLNDKIPIAAGIQYIFRLPDGHEITDVTQFAAGRSYAVSSTRKLNTSIQYGDVSRKCHTHGDDELCDEDPIIHNINNNNININNNNNSGNNFRNNLSKEKSPSQPLGEPDFDPKPKTTKKVIDAASRQHILDDLNSKRFDDTNSSNNIYLPSNIAGDVPLHNHASDLITDPIRNETRFKPFNDDFKSSLDATNSDDDKQNFQNHARYYLPRSEPRSFQSSAESSGSGSDKLSRFEQPRNKTFLPVDESDQDTLLENKNLNRKDGKYERTSHQQRPRRNSDLRSSRKSDSLPRLDSYRFNIILSNDDRHPKKNEKSLPTHYKNYDVTGSYSANQEMNNRQQDPQQGSKLWSPMSLQNHTNRPLQNFKKAKPRIIQIISNTVRKSQQRVIFNPKTLQSFEEVLKDLESMVKLLYPPATALFTAEEPFVKVLSLSHLSRELSGCEEFLVCGREGLPLEIHPDHPESSLQRGVQDPNFLPPIKTFRSENNIFPGTNNYNGKPMLRGRLKNDPSPPVTSSQMRPVNIYLNEKPKDSNVVACDGKNCNCRLHETISKLIKPDHMEDPDDYD